MRLIDADAFKEHLAGFVAGGEKAIKETTCGNEWIDGVHTAYREIDNMPTVERPHGKWINDDWVRDAFGEFYRQYACSKCGYKVVKLHPFCVCGADMREGDEE